MNKRMIIGVVAGVALILALIIGVTAFGAHAKVYGSTISDNPVITIKEIQDNKKEFSGKTVKIRGKITDVCQDMGCWFNVNDGTGIMYVDLEMGRKFTIPKNTANQPVTVEGKFKYDNGSLSIIGSCVKIGK